MVEGLVLDDVAVSLAGRTLVAIDRAIAPGEAVTVMGPSGSGKSSLLAFIAGFLPSAFSARGRVSCGGVELTALPPAERRAGLLFQDPLLFPHMNVGANIAFALPSDLRGRERRRTAVAAALESVELAGLEARDPGTLSGGQKARVALARVLASRPRCLLLDEPFSKLDAPLRAQMRSLVFGRARASGLPVLLVTHDEADAQAAGGPVVRLEG